MLVLDRKAQEGLWIGERIYVKVLGVRRQRVKLGIAAPSDLGIAREELRLRSGAEPRAETDRGDQEREDSVDPGRGDETPDRTEAQYGALLDAIPDMIFRLSREGRFLEFIPAKGQEPAVPATEFLGKTMYEVLPPDVARQTMDCVDRALQTGETQLFEYQLPVPLPRGDLRDYETRIAVSGNDEVLCIVRDITERKRAEEALRESEERLHALVTHAPVVLFALDRDGVFTACEGKGMEPLLANPRELVGRSVFDLGRATPQIVESARRALAGESFAVTAEVAGVVFETRLAPVLDPHGTVTGVVGVATDVTERKRVEEALHESDQRLRTVVENAPVGLFAIDREGVITLSEGKAQGAMGLKAGEHVGLSMFEVYRDFPGIIEGMRRVLAGDAMTSTIRVGRVFLEVRTTPVQDEDGKITGAIGVATDVTERRRAEKGLRESEENYRSLVEASPDAITLTDLDTNIITCNEQMAHLHGFQDVDDLLSSGANAFDLVAPEDRERAIDNGRNLMETGTFRNVEYTLVRKDGTSFAGELSVSLIRDAEGKPKAYTAVTRDVTERHRAEKALRESEQRLRSLVTNAPVVLFAVDRDGVFTLMEGRGLSTLGLKPGQHVGLSIFDVYRDVPELIDAARRALAGEEFATTVPAARWVFEAHVSPVRDHDGTITGAIAVATDITDRKRAEEALRDREHVLTEVQAITHVGSWDIDLLTGGETLSDEMYAIYGINKGADTHIESVMKLVHPDDEKTVRQASEDAVGGNPPRLEYRIVRPDGEIRTVLTEGARLIRDETARPVRLIGSTQDITERKRAEEALRDSEERFRALSEATVEGIVIHDSAVVLDANPQAAAMLGCELSEVIGREPLSFVAPESRDLVRQHILSGYETPYEVLFLRKDGTTLPVEVCGKAVSYQGRVVRMGAVRDITERKRAEEALIEAREELESRVENAARRGNPYGLTFRELTVLDLVSAGRADKEIASELGISPRTANKHLENILYKMGSASRTEAGVRAVQEGLLGQAD